jgi:hypothetical protein
MVRVAPLRLRSVIASRRLYTLQVYIDSCTEGNVFGPIMILTSCRQTVQTARVPDNNPARTGTYGDATHQVGISSRQLPFHKCLRLSIYLMHWPFCRRKPHDLTQNVSAGTTFSVSLFRYVLTRRNHVKYHFLFRPSLVTFLLMMYRLRKSIVAYSRSCIPNSRAHCSVNANPLLVSLLRNRKLKSEVSSISYLHKNVRPVFINSYVPVC